MYRSSLERHHAPYRGVTSRSDSVNFDLASVHDLFHIHKVSGGQSPFVGHQQVIQNSLTSFYTGDVETSATIPTAGTIVHTLKKAEGAQNLSNWNPLHDGQVTVTATGWRLQASGSFPGAGVTKLVSMKPGDVLRIRLHITEDEQDQTVIGIGALNFEGGNDVLYTPLEAFKDGDYLTYRLRSGETQDVRLVLYIAYETTSGKRVRFHVRDFSVDFIQETPVYVKGIESTVKPDLNTQKDMLDYMEDEWLHKGDHR